MQTKELRSVIRQIEISAQKGVAQMSLASLRLARDTSSTEWDALMKSESGQYVLALWDYLREIENQ